MLTSSLISKIKSAVENYSRQQILDEINDIQEIVYSNNTHQTLKFDPLTGTFPYIATTDGIYEYDCPSDCRQTAAIVSEYPINTYTYPINSSSFYAEYLAKNKYYSEIPISSKDALQGVLATVMFKINPGTTTDKYFHIYFIKPTELSSENIQLTLPPRFHYLIVEMVLARLSSENYGKTGFDSDVFEKNIKKIVWGLNQGAQGIIKKTNWQLEYLDE